ncbi:MAG: phasin family protein [Burkholderiales bacterium]|nr:phasin family protein [Burkholderiales bacterium]MDP2398307.1 phasin family protein [Burkholderiales bacterium]
MSKASDAISEMNQKAAEAAMNLTRLSMEQGERLLKLQLETVRGMLDDGVKAAKVLGEARDPQQWSALQQRNMRDMIARITDYSRSVQELAGKTQKEVGGAFEARMQAMNAQFEAMVDDMAKTAPPGSEAAFAAMKQTLGASRAMVDAMTKTSQQFAQSAQSAIKAAADVASKVDGKGGKSS